ncbi:MAG: two-component system LytT family response regulator [Arenicella sp.]|jgi:two-component system LytT family response regulator
MNTTHTAILVDDEEGARNVLKSLLEMYCPQITLIDSCEDVEQAVISIKKNKPDLVFLDIEMPNYAGYEIASFFDEIDFKIIFITAYDQYALKAFDLSALDYLLKPIETERLVQAVEKFEKSVNFEKDALNYQTLLSNLNSNEVKKLVVQVQGGQKVIDISEIVALEASESYCIIHTLSQTKYLYSRNLKHFENLLSENKNFIRTHKSWMVNINHLKSYSKSKFIINLEKDIQAKLSKYKVTHFQEALIS